MKPYFFILFLSSFVLTNISAQKKINNQKTPKHQLITGSDYWMIPPDNFVPASNFQGFQQESTGATILLVEVAVPIHATTLGFNKDLLAKEGILLQKKKEVTVNGVNGFLMTIEQSLYGITFKKYSLVFGDENMTTIINGTFPEDEKKVDKPILKALMTIAKGE